MRFRETDEEPLARWVVMVAGSCLSLETVVRSSSLVVCESWSWSSWSLSAARRESLAPWRACCRFFRCAVVAAARDGLFAVRLQRARATDGLARARGGAGGGRARPGAAAQVVDGRRRVRRANAASRGGGPFFAGTRGGDGWFFERRAESSLPWAFLGVSWKCGVGRARERLSRDILGVLGVFLGEMECACVCVCGLSVVDDLRLGRLRALQRAEQQGPRRAGARRQYFPVD